MKNKTEKKAINILWTGGWDSTYRIIELSFQNTVVQPIYVIDSNRGSFEYEIHAMNTILDSLRLRNETKANFLPIQKVNLSDISRNNEVSFAYEKIRKSVRIGSQYEWLGWLALQYPGLEIGIEKPKGEFNGCVAAIEKYGKFKKVGSVFVVDQDASTDEINWLFGNLVFPIADITELEMLENIKKWKYEDVIKNIWFCHSPIKNQPCGVCRPYQQKMECGMEWLLPLQSQKRYRVYVNMRRKFDEKFASRISRLIIRQH